MVRELFPEAHLVIAELMPKFYRLLLHTEFEMWDMTETRIELYHKFQSEISDGQSVEFDGQLCRKLQKINHYYKSLMAEIVLNT
jgi:hypothetical protein